MRWAGHVAYMGASRGPHRVLVGKTEDKRPFRRPRHRWEDSLKWMFRKWDVRAWPGLISLRIGTGSWLL
jgi:hypothetical protein